MSLEQHLRELKVSTNGPGFTRLNERLNDLIAKASIETGMLHLTCLHTSASLTINENADPRVLKDLQAWMDAVVPHHVNVLWAQARREKRSSMNELHRVHSCTS